MKGDGVGVGFRSDGLGRRSYRCGGVPVERSDDAEDVKFTTSKVYLI